MTSLRLVYFADPMCSWCWGFAAVIAAIEDVWGETLPFRLVMGGLRPGTAEPMAPAAKADLRGHWRQVTEASGQPFGESGLDRDGFIYDTDPAARAVVLFRRRDPSGAMSYLHALQDGFYAGAKDITDFGVLAALAGERGQDPAAFAEGLCAEDVKQETWRDYAIARGAGVNGFPTLILGPRIDGTYLPITRGYRSGREVVPLIATALASPDG